MIEAVDGGVSARTGLTRLRISVVDVDDNSPRFDRSFYEVSIPECKYKCTPSVRIF